MSRYPRQDYTAADDVTVGDDLVVTGLATVAETLAVAGNVSFTKNSGTVTVGTTDPVVITHTANTLTLSAGDSLVIGEDLSVGDDLNLTSTGAILTMGPAATNPITLTQSADTLTLGTGDAFVADDITINDDLTLNSAGAIILIGDGANAVSVTHTTNTLTLGAGDSLVVGEDLSVGDDLNLTSTGAVITIGPAATNPVVLTQSADTLTLATGDTLAVTDADKLTVGGLIVPATQYESFTIRPHATITEYDLMIAHRALTVTAIKFVPSTLQGGALTATVVKATGTATPVKTTTPMIAADAIDCNVNAYTVVTPALTATGADLSLVAGERIGIDFSAALTAGLGTLTIAYKYA